jgi:3-dehydroquinate dehydratase
LQVMAKFMKFMSEKTVCKLIVSSHNYDNTLLAEDPRILLAHIQVTLVDIVKVAW